MGLAIFDLDDTLLAGDSDYLWGKFLVDQGVVDREYHERENARFFAAYQAGRLDIDEWLRFQLRPLAEIEPKRLETLRNGFIRDLIEPIILPAGRRLIESHRAKGHEVLIITSTNAFITRPIADLLGIPELLATEPERRGGRPTGAVEGTPAFREGKVTRLHAWLAAGGRRLGDLESWFYSDSHNDLPLLEEVSHPVAVDPDEELARTAADRGWPVISLR